VVNSDTRPSTAKDLIHHLMHDAKMSAADISEALGKRVSRRTVYRWLKGESEPQQNSDLAELNKLYDARSAA
jgi:transcriptional regulator with XRE-family HTH domain